jgi:multidrug efflux system membrane fusion protein
MSAPNPDFRVRDGVTARLSIPVGQEPAHLVSPSILTLTDDGVVGVKLLDADDRVRFQEVDILDDTREGVWIAGLPERVTLITVGQNFVNVGQKVAPVTESDVAQGLEDAPLDLPAGAPGKPGPEARR